MTDSDLIQALRRIKAETGSLVCLECGHEHNCSTHGCAVINEAVERLEADQNTTLGGTYVSIEWFKSVEAKLKGYEKLAQEGRLVVLDEPRKALIWGDDAHATMREAEEVGVAQPPNDPLTLEHIRHGRWLKNTRFKQERRKCSECGFDSAFEFNFCPNFGAQMDLTGDDWHA